MVENPPSLLIGRRGFIIGGFALAGCGSENPNQARPVEAAVTALPPPSPPPRPSPDGPRPTGRWYVEGDSYMLGAMFMGLREFLGEEVLLGAVGGSMLSTIRDRIMGTNATLRNDPLIMWDGAMNGHVLGSIDLEMSLLRDIVRFKADRQNWLLVLPVPVSFDPAAPLDDAALAGIVSDIATLKTAVVRTYGERHVFDPTPEINFGSSESPLDADDIAVGLPPRSALVDGIHLTDPVKRAVAARLAAPGGPMSAVRAL